MESKKKDVYKYALGLNAFCSHLGRSTMTKKSVGHRLDEPTEEIRGRQLPFVVFMAPSLAKAKGFIEDINYFADAHKLDGYDIIRLVSIYQVLLK